MKQLMIVLATTALLSACSKEEDFKVSQETVAPASKIDWLGQETALLGEGKLHVGEPFPIVELSNSSMKKDDLKPDGRVKLISVVPSLDTEVCDRQTHILGESKKLNEKVERITISRDLPYAQRRFADESKIKGIAYLSDYRAGAFGHVTGLEIERNGLLARAVIVVDGQGIVRHLQITPKIYTLPDMEKAISVANELVL